MSRPSCPGLLIIAKACGNWLLGKLQGKAHHRARPRTGAILLFQLQDARVSAPRPQPALYPFGALLWGCSSWPLRILHEREVILLLCVVLCAVLCADLSQLLKEPSSLAINFVHSVTLSLFTSVVGASGVFPVLLDTCALFKPNLRDVLLGAAWDGIYRPQLVDCLRRIEARNTPYPQTIEEHLHCRGITPQAAVFARECCEHLGLPMPG
jgi:hypothetical protein